MLTRGDFRADRVAAYAQHVRKEQRAEWHAQTAYARAGGDLGAAGRSRAAEQELFAQHWRGSRFDPASGPAYAPVDTHNVVGNARRDVLPPVPGEPLPLPRLPRAHNPLLGFSAHGTRTVDLPAASPEGRAAARARRAEEDAAADARGSPAAGGGGGDGRPLPPPRAAELPPVRRPAGTLGGGGAGGETVAAARSRAAGGSLGRRAIIEEQRNAEALAAANRALAAFDARGAAVAQRARRAQRR